MSMEGMASTSAHRDTNSMKTVPEVLHALERQRFYGSLEIKYEAGRVVLLRKTETIKPTGENCRMNRGIKNEHDT